MICLYTVCEGIEVASDRKIYIQIESQIKYNQLFTV